MTENNKYSVLLVDDHALFRNGLKLLLNSHPKFRVSGEAGTGTEMLALLRAGQTGLFLLYAAASLLLGLAAVWAGHRLALLF